MSHRAILTDRQRVALFALPTHREELVARYVLSDADIRTIQKRKGPANRLGFALQLCAFRWPGRLLQPKEVIPAEMLSFVSAQLGIENEDALFDYGARTTTRYQHSSSLQQIYGYKPFEARARKDMLEWLTLQAATTSVNSDLAISFLGELRRRQIIVPAASVIERLCGEALVRAEKSAIENVNARLEPHHRARLDSLLEDIADDRISRFISLRSFETGRNSADMHRLLDRLEIIEGLDLPDALLEGISQVQVDRLKSQGDRLYSDGLRRLMPDRRYAILAVTIRCLHEKLTDAAIETNDRILSRLWNEAARAGETAIADSKVTTRDTLKGFIDMGNELIAAHENGENLNEAMDIRVGWDRLGGLISDALSLTVKLNAEPIDYIKIGLARVRRYAKRFLSGIAWKAAKSSRAVLDAIGAYLTSAKDGGLPIKFARPKWKKRVLATDGIDRPLWELAVIYELRAGLRSGDIWVRQSARYQELETALLPMPAVSTSATLAVPFAAKDWLEAKKAEMTLKFAVVSDAAREGRLANAELSDGKLTLKRLTRAIPDDASSLVSELYGLIDPVRITDLLLEIDDQTGFTDMFTDVRNGTPPPDRRALLTVLIADGLNLGLKKMADACPDFSYWELLRTANWHVRTDTYQRALDIVTDAHAELPFAKFWGSATSSSSDGQHMPAGAQGEAMNIVNLKYGTQPGMSSYTHVSDQFAPFHTQRIGGTAHEAPYVLDGLLCHNSSLQIKDHFVDTGGFSDHVFAAASFIGFQFIPRIRGLEDHRLYAFDLDAAPSNIRPLIARRVNEKLILDNWPEMLRAAASMSARTVVPSQYLRKLAAYPKRNALSRSWREVGRVIRTLFVLDWLLDEGIQRQAQVGLNKGEAHHALKAAIHFHRKGEIRDRTRENQDLRIAGMNFLAASIIFWNGSALGKAVQSMIEKGAFPDPALMKHVSPLGWEHIILTGEYRWDA